MKKLFCFIGKPGAGKTTLLEHLGVDYVDVFTNISRYKDKNGVITEDDKQKAWDEFFRELEKNTKEIQYAELGTNKPQFAIENVHKLHSKTKIFLCVLDSATCLQRHKTRTGRRIVTEQLMEKLARDFPNEHLKFIEKYGIPYVILDMARPVDENAAKVKEIISKYHP